MIQDNAQLVGRIGKLREQGQTFSQIAKDLSAEGVTTARGLKPTTARVTTMFFKHRAAGTVQRPVKIAGQTEPTRKGTRRASQQTQTGTVVPKTLEDVRLLVRSDVSDETLGFLVRSLVNRQ
jgi:hypothetical protein